MARLAHRSKILVLATLAAAAPACNLVSAAHSGLAEPARVSPSSSSSPSPSSRPEVRVIVTIPPLVGLVQSLAPAGVKVIGLMQPGQSEHGYEFVPSDMNALARSDMVVYIGMGLEPGIAKFMAKKADDRRRVVVLGEVLGLQKPGVAPEPHIHKAGEPEPGHDQHGDQKENADHAVTDVHIWLDPVLVRQSLPHISAALKKVVAAKGEPWTGAEKEIDQKLAAALQNVDALHERFKATLAPYKGRSIVTHHAAFGRLAERYDIKIAEVIRPFESAEPTPGQLEEVIKAIRAQNVKTIFVVPQFNASAAQRIAQAAHVRLGHLDPLGDGDWFKLMETNLAELVKGFADEVPAGAAPK